MAYVVERPAGSRGSRRFEVRESLATERGPRSRSLATFAELDEVVLAKARTRALRPFDDGAVVAAARRIDAPVVIEPPAERHARALLAELRAGRRPPPALAALLRRALDDVPAIDDNAQAAAEWIGATPEQRADALVDLLGLADAIRSSVRRSDAPVFPRISSR